MDSQVSISQIVANYWQIVGSFIVFIAWLVKLEIRSTSSVARIKKLEEKEDSMVKLNEKVTAIDAKLSVLIPDYNGK